MNWLYALKHSLDYFTPADWNNEPISSGNESVSNPDIGRFHVPINSYSPKADVAINFAERSFRNGLTRRFRHLRAVFSLRQRAGRAAFALRATYVKNDGVVYRRQGKSMARPSEVVKNQSSIHQFRLNVCASKRSQTSGKRIDEPHRLSLLTYFRNCRLKNEIWISFLNLNQTQKWDLKWEMRTESTVDSKRFRRDRERNVFVKNPISLNAEIITIVSKGSCHKFPEIFYAKTFSVNWTFLPYRTQIFVQAIVQENLQKLSCIWKH